jgi:hypothetical protein
LSKPSPAYWMCRFCACLIDSLSRLSLMACKSQAYGSARSISNLSSWAQLEQYQSWAFGLSSAPANQALSHFGSAHLNQTLLARPSLVCNAPIKCLDWISDYNWCLVCLGQYSRHHKSQTGIVHCLVEWGIMDQLVFLRWRNRDMDRDGYRYLDSDVHSASAAPDIVCVAIIIIV